MGATHERQDPAADWDRWIAAASDEDLVNLYLKTEKEEIGLELENPRGKSVSSEMLLEEMDRRGLEPPAGGEILSDQDLEDPT